MKKALLIILLGVCLICVGALAGGYTASRLMRHKWAELATHQNQLTDIVVHQGCMIQGLQEGRSYILTLPCAWDCRNVGFQNNNTRTP